MNQHVLSENNAIAQHIIWLQIYYASLIVLIMKITCLWEHDICTYLFAEYNFLINIHFSASTSTLNDMQKSGEILSVAISFTF